VSFSYRHRFHAGNFADVFKHALLARTLALLARKDKPLAYVDTHAGIGLYDLAHPWSRKNAEHAGGIGRLWGRRDLPAALGPWMDVVRAHNESPRLRYYPGSPLVAAGLLREQDSLALVEHNAEDCEALRACMRRGPRAGVHRRDAGEALAALLPPRERRGMVLVDPPYDTPGQLERLPEVIAKAHRRFATGVLAAWYPLLDAHSMARLERRLGASGVHRMLQLELWRHPPAPGTGLRGCGMVIVNPPHRLEEDAAQWLGWLAGALAPEGKGGQRVRWLAGE